MIRRNVLFSGRVQGVGFRATVQKMVRRTPVKGYVHNLDDGRVEAVFEGEASDIDDVLRRVAEEMGPNIASVERKDAAATGEFVRFAVRR